SRWVPHGGGGDGVLASGRCAPSPPILLAPDHIGHATTWAALGHAAGIGRVRAGLSAGQAEGLSGGDGGGLDLLGVHVPVVVQHVGHGGPGSPDRGRLDDGSGGDPFSFGALHGLHLGGQLVPCGLGLSKTKTVALGLGGGVLIVVVVLVLAVLLVVLLVLGRLGGLQGCLGALGCLLAVLGSLGGGLGAH